jgi:hypothetical protein
MMQMVKNPVCRHMLVQKMNWRYVVLDEGHVVRNVEVRRPQQRWSRHHTTTYLLCENAHLAVAITHHV